MLVIIFVLVAKKNVVNMLLISIDGWTDHFQGVNEYASVAVSFGVSWKEGLEGC